VGAPGRRESDRPSNLEIVAARPLRAHTLSKKCPEAQVCKVHAHQLSATEYVGPGSLDLGAGQNAWNGAHVLWAPVGAQAFIKGMQRVMERLPAEARIASRRISRASA
jgi:hypothetical protein